MILKSDVNYVSRFLLKKVSSKVGTVIKKIRCKLTSHHGKKLLATLP